MLQCLVEEQSKIYDKCSIGNIKLILFHLLELNNKLILGKFLLGHSKISTGQPFETSLYLNINLKRIGIYRFYYHSILYCNDLDCKVANDYISIRETSLNKTYSTIKLTSQKEENKWIENHFDFDVDQENLNYTVCFTISLNTLNLKYA